MNANPGQTVDPSRIEISNHAELRAMMRLGVVERTRDYLRELLDEAEVEEVDHVTDAQAWRVGDVTIVVDPYDEVATTVLPPEAGR